jgi:hypothetical protein
VARTLPVREKPANDGIISKSRALPTQRPKWPLRQRRQDQAEITVSMIVQEQEFK